MNLYKYLILVVFILLAAFPAQSHEATDSLAPTFLWKIEGNGLPQASYLYGTIHLLPEKDYFLEDEVKDAFAKAEILAMEVNLDMSPVQQMKLMQRMTLPGQQTLPDVVGDSLFQAFRAYSIDSLGISQNSFQKYLRFKPFGLTSLFMMELYGEGKSYEQEFMKRAKLQGKEIMGLETLDFQFDLIDSIPYPEQLKMFVGTDFREEYETLARMYKARDLAGIARLTANDAEIKKLEDSLLFRRNKKWAKKLQGRLSRHSYFVAVGAAHLPGPEGLIALLRGAGYTVSPIQVK